MENYGIIQLLLLLIVITLAPALQLVLLVIFFMTQIYFILAKQPVIFMEHAIHLLKLFINLFTHLMASALITFNVLIYQL